jgi:tetratricopeptide (TPR) repeat protein
VDPLGPPNQIQFHSFYDNYYLLVTPSAEPQVKDVRRAYLHFLLDPMATQAGAEFRPSRVLVEYVQAAPLLGPEFKTDYLLLATRSLVRTIEARFDYPAGAARTAAAQAAAKEGFILAEHFAEQLPIYEKQEVAMKLYLPEMAKAIDLAKEEKRLAKLEFAEKSAVRVARGAPPAAPVDNRTPTAKRLDEAEDLYVARQLDAARAMFLELAEKAPEKRAQAKAYYGLARIAVLSRNPELAEQLFTRSLELEPEDAVKAWDHVYLGRLNDAAGEKDVARRAYEEALKVPGISQQARQAAEQGLQKK